jgi:hypothetical protein
VPTFRLSTRDGNTSTITAMRIVVSSDEVRFQARHGGSWMSVNTTPLAATVRVERQLTEHDGRRLYVDDRGVSDALAALEESRVTGRQQ